eukprot:3279621-Pleurochrysis_carterae.AAC.1
MSPPYHILVPGRVYHPSGRRVSRLEILMSGRKRSRLKAEVFLALLSVTNHHCALVITTRRLSMGTRRERTNEI